MKQEEFFRLLDRRLSVIEDGERQDILNEYRQHIAMKIQEDHISEEDALADFGDVDSFADDILSAYHVRNSPAKEQALSIVSRVKGGIQNFFSKIGDFFKNCGRHLSHFWGLCTAKIKNLMHCEKVKEEPVHQGESHWKESLSRTFRKFLHGCHNLFFGLLGTIFWIFTAILLVIFGACIVLAVRGYPLIGLTVLLLGLLLSNGAVAVLFCRKSHKKEETQNA